MRSALRCVVGLGLIGLGYVLGASGMLSPTSARAQIDPDSRPSQEAEDKIRAAFGALRDAADMLEQEGRYRLATGG
ncbi:MAG TPA: hypothetical protein EYP14_09060, partial [Planctomycetaceae bacterium]|nr:hypothetical protein [Planctomycetaceae bacterium]